MRLRVLMTLDTTAMTPDGPHMYDASFVISTEWPLHVQLHIQKEDESWVEWNLSKECLAKAVTRIGYVSRPEGSDVHIWSSPSQVFIALHPCTSDRLVLSWYPTDLRSLLAEMCQYEGYYQDPTDGLDPSMFQ